MKIDKFYSRTDKSNYYLGMVSAVYPNNANIQIENLSLLGHRILHSEELVPNTINYLVLIDSVTGLFIGRVNGSKVNSSNSVHQSMNKGISESVYPEMNVEIIGLFNEVGELKINGFNNVGITDKVYIASEEAIKKYISCIQVNGYTKDVTIDLGAFLNLPNTKVTLNPNSLFDKHLLSLGMTNSGKSTSALTILDKLVSQKMKVLIIDPTGEYSDAFNGDEITKCKLGENTGISYKSLSSEQWRTLFSANNNTQGAVLAKAIESLRFQRKNGCQGIYNKDGRAVTEVAKELSQLEDEDLEFDINYLADQVLAESLKFKKSNYEKDDFSMSMNLYLHDKIDYTLNYTDLKRFFDTEKLDSIEQVLHDFISKPETSLYIDASSVSMASEIGSFIIDIVTSYLIKQPQNDIEPFVLFIDEVHRYFQNGENSISWGLKSIAREGRKKGIFLYLTTQSPKDISNVLLSQIGTLIVHRLSQSDDIDAIKGKLQVSVIQDVRNLGKGEAIISSANLLQNIQIKFHKSNRQHHNDTPELG